jgi:accessory gene regulator B
MNKIPNAKLQRRKVMFSKASESLANQLVKKQIIKSEDIELYQFGIENIIIKVVHIVSYFTIGLIFQLIPELILFLITFIPLRESSGGYHAKTPIKCYVVSCGAVTAALCLIKFMPDFLKQFSMIIALIASLILFIIVPVETENKPLDDSEMSYYKSKAGFIIVIELGLVLIFRMISWNYYSFILALSLAFEMLIAIAGIYENALTDQ